MNTTSKTSILILDEHPIVRLGIRDYLSREANVAVLGEAASVADALVQARLCRPDVIVADVSLVSEDTALATHALSREAKNGVLAFCTCDTWDCAQECLNAGAGGFVPKRSPMSELLAAVRIVSRGGTYISPSLRRVELDPANAGGLSTRECEIAALVAQGLTSVQIAEQLCISRRTVETHRSRVMKKLGLRCRSQLVVYARDNGLLR